MSNFHNNLFLAIMKRSNLRIIVRLAILNKTIYNFLVHPNFIGNYLDTNGTLDDHQENLHELFLDLAEIGAIGLFERIWRTKIKVGATLLMREHRSILEAHRVAWRARRRKEAQSLWVVGHNIDKIIDSDDMYLATIVDTVQRREDRLFLRYELNAAAEAGDKDSYIKAIMEIDQNLRDACVGGSLVHSIDIDFFLYAHSLQKETTILPSVRINLYRWGRLDLIDELVRRELIPHETIRLLSCPHPEALSRLPKEAGHLDLVTHLQWVKLFPSTKYRVIDCFHFLSSAEYLTLMTTIFENNDRCFGEMVLTRLKRHGYEYLHSRLSQLITNKYS